MRRSGFKRGLAGLAMAAPCVLMATCAFGQSRPSVAYLATRQVAANVDSGEVANAGGDGLAPVFSTLVSAPGSAWVRLSFDQLVLSGDPGTEKASELRITSLFDGAVQRLDALSAAQWAGHSAYFNGSTVRVEIWSAAGTGTNRVAMSMLLADDPDAFVPLDICGETDDRVPSTDNRVARLLSNNSANPAVCTSWIFNDTNHFFLSAGHCVPGPSSIVEFNVPPSTASGQLQHPPPDDQYSVEGLSVQRTTNGTGNDWSYFGVFSNPNTFLQPFQAYGGNLTLAAAPPAPNQQTLRVTGNGVTNFPVPPERNFTQQTSTGPFVSAGATLRYNVDTSGGNSGSPVIDESTGLAIGIHYLAGCTSGGNQATPINNTNLQNAITNPFGICRSGVGTVAGNLYALGDAANNFGTVNGPPNKFARIGQAGAGGLGLAYDPNTATFYGCDKNRVLFTIVLGEGGGAGSASVANIAQFSGTGSTINGLAFDPVSRTLYGIAQATGQLFSIDPATAAVTAIGSPQGGRVGGLAFDTSRNVLWGLDNQPTGTRLVRVNTTTGVRTVIGALGTNIADCYGVAWNAADDTLYTILSVDDFLYRINPATGAATRVGFTFAQFNAGFGVTAVNPPPPPACAADFNADGALNADDLGDFITGYFNDPADARCDFNGDGVVNGDDLGDFITAYFNGC